MYDLLLSGGEHFPGMVCMNKQCESLGIRKGQFLWMDPLSRDSYIKKLKSRISDGYYNSDNILSRVVDELASVMAESVDSE